MSEEQVEAKENVAEELTEWSEVDLSPASEQEKIEFEVEGAEPEVESKPEVEEASPEPNWIVVSLLVKLIDFVNLLGAEIISMLQFTRSCSSSPFSTFLKMVS